MTINTRCIDCGVNTTRSDEYYMATGDVWAAAGMTTARGMLCIGCLEQRLGRTLTPDDFTDCPVNRERWNRRSSRLQQRMTETPLPSAEADNALTPGGPGLPPGPIRRSVLPLTSPTGLAGF